MPTHDIIFALRTLRKTPGLTAVVAVSIALGIAANTTVFSMVNATLLGALPVRDPDGLLYGLSSTDVVTFTAVPLALLATALAAVVLPARRAAAINPIDALRLE